MHNGTQLATDSRSRERERDREREGGREREWQRKMPVSVDKRKMNEGKYKAKEN